MHWPFNEKTCYALPGIPFKESFQLLPGNRPISRWWYPAILKSKIFPIFLKGFIVYFVLTFWLISGNCYPEIDRFPGIITRRSNLEKKTWFFFILNSYKSFITEYIYKNQLWTICTYIGLWFEGKKKWGHLWIL